MGLRQYSESVPVKAGGVWLETDSSMGTGFNALRFRAVRKLSQVATRRLPAIAPPKRRLIRIDSFRVKD